MNKQWASYRWEYEYAKFVSFEETCDAVFDALNGLSRAESDKLNPL